jgi:hypothetical protein
MTIRDYLKHRARTSRYINFGSLALIAIAIFIAFHFHANLLIVLFIGALILPATMADRIIGFRAICPRCKHSLSAGERDRLMWPGLERCPNCNTDLDEQIPEQPQSEMT